MGLIIAIEKLQNSVTSGATTVISGGKSHSSESFQKAQRRWWTAPVGDLPQTRIKILTFTLRKYHRVFGKSAHFVVTKSLTVSFSSPQFLDLKSTGRIWSTQMMVIVNEWKRVSIRGISYHDSDNEISASVSAETLINWGRQNQQRRRS